MRNGRLTATLWRLLRAVATLTVLCSVVAALAIPHHSVALLSHFRLQYLAASVLLVIVFAFRRMLAATATLLAVAAINAAAVLPWYFPDGALPPDAADDRIPVKVVHANVHASNSDYPRLLDFIADEKPDLVLLQEINADWMQGTAGLAAEYPFTYAIPRNGNFGIAVFSKIAFDSVTHVDSPPLGYPTIIAELTTGSGPLTIISSHPTIPLGRSLATARNVQFRHIAELAGKAGGNLIVAGDFNASLWDSQLVNLVEVTHLRNVRRGFGVLPSWPTFMPPAMIPIDHILVSENIRVLDAHVGRRIGSDHLPLVVTLSL